jgi:alkanesulfonate monooxygenase SsuD/methylene tetrahydromethanopterin reductase-like flavin-dependent oxidoreductase (luciferase family)
MVGGGGERKTLRLVAEFGDWWCADIGPVETFARKREVLARHCEAVGRDPSSIVHSQATWIGFLERGQERPPEWPGVHIVTGDPVAVADQLRAYREAGVDHFQIRFMDFPARGGMDRFAAEVLPRLQ